ncbi:MAG: fasciclin domain-containing protein [Planctomycetota bacterium]
MKRTLMFALALAGILSSNFAVAQETSTKTIPEVAAAAGQFKTLVTAVEAAGLLETLAGDGPFTVLAPTDEAFAKLPAGTVESLVKPENKEKLVAILKLHVAGDKLTSDMAQPGVAFPNLAGQPLKVGIEDGKITVGAATVIKKDIECSNGVIHVIDTVLLPASSSDQKALDPKELVGKWVYTKAVKNGTKRTAEQLEGQKVEITEKSFTLTGDAKFVMDYTIDSDKSPNEIKLTITESPFGAGMSTGGLIKMEGDLLVLCYSAQGGAAPSEFASKEGSGVNLFYMKKAE